MRLSDATQLAIQRQQHGPWCSECNEAMPQAVRDLGYSTHPCCGAFEEPNPLVAQGLEQPLTGRERGKIMAARQTLATPAGPDRTTRLDDEGIG